GEHLGAGWIGEHRPRTGGHGRGGEGGAVLVGTRQCREQVPRAYLAVVQGHTGDRHRTTGGGEVERGGELRRRPRRRTCRGVHDVEIYRPAGLRTHRE